MQLLQLPRQSFYYFNYEQIYYLRVFNKISSKFEIQALVKKNVVNPVKN